MTKPVPDDVVDAIVRMKGQSRTNVDIAMATGMTISSIENICFRHRIKRPSNGRLDIPAGVKLKTRLQEEAELREIPLNRFLRTLLKNIADSDLFAAILDDNKK